MALTLTNFVQDQIDELNATFGTPAQDECGSNAYGAWEKRADGVLECWSKSPAPSGSAVVFPMAFLGNPDSITTGMYATNSSSGAQYRVLSVYNISPTGFNMGYITGGGEYMWRAIGRWK